MASMLLGFVAQRFDWVSLNQLQNTQKSQKWHKEPIKILKCDDMETAWSYQVTIDYIFVRLIEKMHVVRVFKTDRRA